MATGKPVDKPVKPTDQSNREITFKPSDFLVKTPVIGQTGPVNWSNRSVYRSEPVTHVLLNLDLNSTGFRSNRSGKPLPEGGGLTGPVGLVNPGIYLTTKVEVSKLSNNHTQHKPGLALTLSSKRPITSSRQLKKSIQLSKFYTQPIDK